MKKMGLEGKDDWFEYRPENDPRFLKRVEAARAKIGAGKGGRACRGVPALIGNRFHLATPVVSSL